LEERVESIHAAYAGIVLLLRTAGRIDAAKSTGVIPDAS
jgi:hypothetical protein